MHGLRKRVRSPRTRVRPGRMRGARVHMDEARDSGFFARGFTLASKRL
jgi:hypothetical protein